MFLVNCIIQSISLKVWIISCSLRKLLSIQLPLWFIHCCISKLSPTCWNILPSLICQWLLLLKIVVSCPLLWSGSTSYSLVPVIVIHSSLEYKSMVLHILTWISLFVLLLIIHPTIGLMLLPPWLLLNKPSHLIPLVLLLSG